MKHNTLQHSRTRIDQAGRTLLDPSASQAAIDDAWSKLENWRSVHAFPLNTVTMDLRQKVNRRAQEAIVVQRLKRARSILAKLTKQSMRLTQMQDIGGCRAVVASVSDVYAIRDGYHRSRALHELVEEDDYITSPKSSGYRSYHLVYRFKSKAHPQYNGLLFEIQLRTITQHAWATAVETVGAVIGQALKASEGEATWLRYFQNASLALEYTESPTRIRRIGMNPRVIARRVDALGNQLGVAAKLRAFRTALRATEQASAKQAAYFLLVLYPERNALEIMSYSRRNVDQAYKEYARLERLIPLEWPGKQLSLFPELTDYRGAQAVLVGAESLRSVRESYPNYYLDTEMFLSMVDGFVQRYRRRS